ncbi:hypothetical protein OAT84_00825 [Gammaproteobacteria bacterium]|nr:hypothetical protein [Gammaproteobacteria bacterium]
MHKSLKFASILLATTSIVSASAVLDGKKFTLEAFYGSNCFYASNESSPGTLVNTSGTQSNFAQNYSTFGLTVTAASDAKFKLALGLELQPTAITYANPSSNITATNATDTALGTLTLGGTDIKADNGTTTVDASNGVDLVATEAGNTTTVTITSDIGGPLERNSYMGVDINLLYATNASTDMGFFFKKGVSEIKVGTLAAVKVNELAFGITTTVNAGEYTSIKVSRSLIASAEADDAAYGSKQDMILSECKVAFTLGSMVK